MPDKIIAYLRSHGIECRIEAGRIMAISEYCQFPAKPDGIKIWHREEIELPCDPAAIRRWLRLLS